jgi:hypothetical protein
MMISLELAQKLKAAGLKWEPKKHDFCGQKGFPCRIYSELSEIEIKFYMDEFYWLPSLSQLLTEIEARGWKWGMDIWAGKCSMQVSNGHKRFNLFDNTPEEAAGVGLLKILEQEGKA